MFVSLWKKDFMQVCKWLYFLYVLHTTPTLIFSHLHPSYDSHQYSPFYPILHKKHRNARLSVRLKHMKGTLNTSDCHPSIFQTYSEKCSFVLFSLVAKIWTPYTLYLIPLEHHFIIICKKAVSAFLNIKREGKKWAHFNWNIYLFMG